MTPLGLFLTLRRHRILSVRRSPEREKNSAARWVTGALAALASVYLVVAAVMLSLAANSSSRLSSPELLCGTIPFIAAADFIARLTFQRTPAQAAKPYSLLPVGKYACVDFFILCDLFRRANFAWLALAVPYCLMSVVFGYGPGTALNLILLFWLIELSASQFYLITRTLASGNALWWLLPAAAVLLFFVLPGTAGNPARAGAPPGFFDIRSAVGLFTGMGDAVREGSPLPCLSALVLLLALLFTNRLVQHRGVTAELSRTERTSPAVANGLLSRLSRAGDTGMFLALETRTILRNRNPRKSFRTAVAVTVVFSLAVIFTDLYDSAWMTGFWCLYDYMIFGTVTLAGVMCPEGNFIDGLMVRKEKILEMLRAKYIFNCAMLLLPFLLMMPAVLSGKWSFLMVLSSGVFTAGFQFFLLFQLAVTNRTARPLNTKLTARRYSADTGRQILTETVCLFIPVTVVTLLSSVLDRTRANLVMLCVGAAFAACHPLWLRNIYKRFMARRYENMEGFRATR